MSDIYELVLYISGLTERSKAAVENVQRIAERHLPGRYRLAVVDLFQEPHRAGEETLIGIPALVKKRPLPARHIVGDLSDERHVLQALDLAHHPAASP